MQRMFFAPLACVSLMVCHTAHAQDTPKASTWELAVKAERDGQLDRALKLYERAYIEEKQPRAIYRRILIYERMGRPAEGLQILEQNKALLTRDDALTELPLLEQRLKKATSRPTGGPTPATTPARSRTVEWVVLGTGTAAAIAGGVLWAGARTDAERLRCTPGVQAEGAACDGVEPLAVSSQSEFDSKRAGVRGRHIAGVALLGVGIGALGWSIWSLVSDDTPQPARADDRVRLHMAPSTRGAYVGMEVHF